jgi:hypothetical protein
MKDHIGDVLPVDEIELKSISHNAKHIAHQLFNNKSFGDILEAKLELKNNIIEI